VSSHGSTPLSARGAVEKTATQKWVQMTIVIDPASLLTLLFRYTDDKEEICGT